MSAKNPKAGRGPCPNCGESVLFRKSPASGRLTYACDHCDHSAYAEPGGAAHAKWSAALVHVEPELDVKPEPAPAPPAPVKKGRSIFELGQLG